MISMIIDDLTFATYIFSNININHFSNCEWLHVYIHVIFNCVSSLPCEIGFKNNVLAFYFNHFSWFLIICLLSFGFFFPISGSIGVSWKHPAPRSSHKSILFSLIQTASCFYHFCYGEAPIPPRPGWVYAPPPQKGEPARAFSAYVESKDRRAPSLELETMLQPHQSTSLECSWEDTA